MVGNVTHLAAQDEWDMFEWAIQGPISLEMCRLFQQVTTTAYDSCGNNSLWGFLTDFLHRDYLCRLYLCLVKPCSCLHSQIRNKKPREEMVVVLCTTPLVRKSECSWFPVLAPLATAIVSRFPGCSAGASKATTPTNETSVKTGHRNQDSSTIHGLKQAPRPADSENKSTRREKQWRCLEDQQLR